MSHDRRPLLSLAAVVTIGLTSSLTSAQTSGFSGDEKKQEDTSPIHFAGDLGLPSFDIDRLSLAWALALGYHGNNFRIGFESAQSFLFSEQNDVTRENAIFSGTNYIGYRTGDGPMDTRHSFEIESEFEGFNTSYAVGDFGEGGFRDEFSIFSRSSMLYGYVSPTLLKPFFWSVIVGVGVQLESYTLDEGEEGDFFGETTSREDISIRFLARANGTWRAAPALLNVRAFFELSQYAATRSTDYFDLDEGVFEEDSEMFEDVSTFEVKSRLYADVIALNFIGLSPNAFIGLDVLASSSSSGGSNNIVVPLIGLGLRN